MFNNLSNKVELIRLLFFTVEPFVEAPTSAKPPHGAQGVTAP